MALLIPPGCSAYKCTPSPSASISLCTHAVRWISAALDTQYDAVYGTAMVPAREAMLRIQPEEGRRWGRQRRMR